MGLHALQEHMLEHVLVFPLSFPEPEGSDVAGRMVAVCSCKDMQSKVSAYTGGGKSSRPEYTGGLPCFMLCMQTYFC